MRQKGYYKVCHPYYMDKEVEGYWDGARWRFNDDAGIESQNVGNFDDDDLNWINEEKIHD